MPLFCYTNADGTKTVEKVFSTAKRRPPKWITVAGEMYFRDIASEHRGVRHAPGNWPCESEFCGVAPEQVGDAIRHDSELGVPADYNRNTGAVIWRSPEHRRRWCHAHQYYDRNGGYSDPQRR